MEVMPTLTLKTTFLVLILCFCCLARADITGRVVAVTDGDTIKVLDASNTEQKVRLTGIDAPERGQPYGTASKDHLASMVAGKEVKVESTKNDRYGRVLGKVWVQPAYCPTCGKTLNTNHAQILAGMAWWYRYYAKDQSPGTSGRTSVMSRTAESYSKRSFENEGFEGFCEGARGR
jgi:endonuclease YncB( thermonuclease family)